MNARYWPEEMNGGSAIATFQARFPSAGKNDAATSAASAQRQRPPRPDSHSATAIAAGSRAKTARRTGIA